MARLKDAVRGHEKIFSFWTQFLQVDQPTASFGFIGPDGVGKKKTAWALMQQALCEYSPEVCGQCRSCLRIEAGHHESILWIAPEKDLIKIEQAREVLDFLSLRSLNPLRFVVLERAETLNAQSANTLLKMIEEPPTGTCFILISQNETALLPTIRSRLIKLRFSPLSPAELGGGAALPEWILRASRGSFSRVAHLADPKTQEFRKEAAELLCQMLLNPEFLTQAEWRDQIKDREFYRSAWGFWIELLRDAFCLRQNRQDLLLAPDQSAALKKLSRLSTSQIDTCLQAVIRAEQDLSIPRDPQLVIEKFFVENRLPAEVN